MLMEDKVCYSLYIIYPLSDPIVRAFNGKTFEES